MNDDILRDLKVPIHGGVPVTPATVFPPRNATTPPVDPIPDGVLVVKSIHGQEHVYEMKDMSRGWKPHTHYLAIPLKGSTVRWPWGQIMWFETTHNSREYVVAKEAYRRWQAEQADDTEGCDGVDSDRG